MYRSLVLLVWWFSNAALAAAADYSDPAAWLCRPEAPNACAADQTTTIVHASGLVTSRDFMKAGSVMWVLSVVVMLIIANTYWKMII